MNKHTQVYPYKHLRETKLADLKIDEVTADASLSTDNSPIIEKIVPLKF
jgi:hypothetical protein